MVKEADNIRNRKNNENLFLKMHWVSNHFIPFKKYIKNDVT